jgi:predicted dinucleotide-binding enzyme
MLAAAPAAHRAFAADGKLKIGTIGAGNIGGTVGSLWVKAGHEVMFSSLDLEQTKKLAASLGPLAHAGTSAEAASFGEVVLISVPYGAIPQIGRDYGKLLAGKVVLETGNPVEGRDGPMAKDALAMGTGLATAGYIHGVRLVRAFSTVGAGKLRSEAGRAGDKVAIPLAGDDQGALEIASRLVRDAGFEPVIVGKLADAKKFDRGAAIYGKALTAKELRQGLGM